MDVASAGLGGSNGGHHPGWPSTGNQHRDAFRKHG
jgi:hypothetical protein